ncbi:hypothetical protein NF556_16310 [Ornithinimicrobium faecis]|uniref:Autoinducer 2 import system permease protein LsrC n=1 Tax=Ornithinimicrobium faecis TaxID=2934158 RepID=A0ABY4YQY3_9MICO|nr:hypothetical protein [Ornithinimicrobium sp. HY1793]USQ79165.1 hypothetical protein NF556_16310 [Ornithinimicrobium sp. HY1793]
MNLRSLLRHREAVTVSGVVILVLLVMLVQPAFAAPSNLLRIANSTVILALLAAGSAVVIMTRNIDVSVGSMLALTGIVGGLMLRDGVPAVLTVVVVLALGAALGVVNGLGVTYGHVPSIVMTLGTLGAYRGLSFLITEGHSIENVPAGYKAIGRADILGVPLLVWLVIVALIGIGLFLGRTRLGRHVYATGDNRDGAHLIGVRTNGVIILAFAVSGVCAAAAALVFLAQVGSISNQAGQGIEMRAIAAAVIGGVALSGGVGTVFGAAAGAVFITAAVSSLSFLGIPGFWADTVIGAILLVALFADARVRKALDHRRVLDRYRAVHEAAPDAAENRKVAQ